MSFSRKIFGLSYRYIFKPLAFCLDAEFVHESMTSIGELLENADWLLAPLFVYEHPSLHRTVLGLHFDNPIGLSAGFDYDGHDAQVLKSVGFGFNTVGTVTAQAYEGNPGKRLDRLPKSKSLFVNKGFKSEGAAAVAKRLDTKNLRGHTVGISIGSTNSPKVNTIQKAIEDYCVTFHMFQNRAYVKYFELNISCPNTSMTESFTNPKNFEQLLKKVTALKLKQPIFVKMPNEIEAKNSDALVSTALKHGVHGFIFSNLVKNRKNPAFNVAEMQKFANMKGNFSGKPTEKNANALIAHTRKKFGKKVAIIGVGGVFGVKDAQAKFNAGADLVQLITGMIYEGPQLIGEICEGLVK
ncbi:MAG TPA: quinone-dependent dihydroorotate dehydrogenase [Candidatus Saccharimonadia bacterium]|nr:quinone-dependent dihydroorotate dehydrogenase [Candidatus Saccharimonadia bacterium]